MKIKKICEQCGKEFEVLDKSMYRNRKTCSKKCRHKLIALNQKKRILLTCQRCGKKFEATPSWVKNGAKFCSHKCYSKSMEKPVYYKCKNCGIKFKTNPSNHLRYDKPEPLRSTNIFCSKKCQYEFVKKNHGYINTNLIRRGKTVKCFQCGKEIYKKRYKLISKKFFCSFRCYKKFDKDNPERKDLLRKHRLGFAELINSPHCDKYLYNWMKGLLFPNISKYQLTDLDKKVIEAKILLFKIRRSSNVNE